MSENLKIANIESLASCAKITKSKQSFEFFLMTKPIPSMDFLNNLKNAMPEKNTGKVPLGISRAIDNIKVAIINSSEIPKSQQENFIHDMDRICSELNLWLKAIEIKNTH